MPTATFDADFSRFYDAVDKADAKLRGFEANSGKVESALNRMVDQFSGRKIIQEATLMAEAVERLGGTSKLTASELQNVSAKASEAVAKLKAMGADVPANLQNIANQTSNVKSGLSSLMPTLGGLAAAFGVTFSVTTLVNFVKGIFDMSDAMEKLATKTNSSIGEVAKLQVISEQTSVDVETLAQSINILQQNISKPEARRALDDLGIGFVELRNLSPYEALKRVGEALKDVQDPAERARLGVETLGRGWSEVLASMGTDWDDLTAKTNTNVGAQVRAMNELEDAITGAWGNAKRAGIDAIGSLIIAGNKLRDDAPGFFKTFGQGLLANLGNPAAALAYVATIETAVKNAGDTAKKSPIVPSLPIEPLKDFAAASGGAFQQIKIGAEGAADASRKLAAADEKRAAEARKVAEAQRELTALGTSYAETITKMDAATVTAVEGYLRAGASQGTLATAYKLTADQVRAVGEALKATNELEKDAMTHAKNLAAAQQHTADVLRARTATETENRIAAINRWYETEVGKINQATGDHQSHYDALKKMREDMLAGVTVNWEQVRAVSASSLQDIANRARATYDVIAQSTADPAKIAEAFKAAETAQAAADRAAGAIQTSMETAGAATTQQTANVVQQTAAVQQLATSYTIVHRSAAQWAEMAATAALDAERMKQGMGFKGPGAPFQTATGIGVSVGQLIANADLAARRYAEKAQTERQYEHARGIARAPYTININAIGGGDAIADALVSGMRQRGVPLG